MAAQISKKKKVGKLANSLLWKVISDNCYAAVKTKLFGTVFRVLIGSDVQISLKIQKDFAAVEASEIRNTCVSRLCEYQNSNLMSLIIAYLYSDK